MHVGTGKTDELTASLGRSVALAYGRHYAGGNVILKDETDPEKTIVFLALGEGEWDAMERLIVNGIEWQVDAPDAGAEGRGFHFHKGLAGQLSSSGDLFPEGLGSPYPFAADGDQKADALTPPGVQGLTFSRTAYLALSIPFDVFAPGPELSVVGIYRCRKVRIFDAAGAQTDYRWSDNPAWCIADLLTRIRGLADSRLDWAGFKAAADYCDALIDPLGDGNQVKRFVTNVAFTEEVDFDAALEALLLTCRGRLLDTAGAIQLRIDQARSSVLDLQDHDTAGAAANIVEGSFQAWRKDTRALPNRLELLFRDPDNDHQIMTLPWDHLPSQAQIGRTIVARAQLGNLPQQQAERIGNYLLTRAIDNNLHCRLRGDPSTLKVMPGDVVRVKHDAAPWSQAASGSALYETFEVLEVTENADETRDFLLQSYRATTYPDTAGPSQNLIGTTVRNRPPAPPAPDEWDLSADEKGFLRLTFTIPRNADYRTGDLGLLVNDLDAAVETTLSAPLGLTDSSLTVADSSGFVVGDYIRIESELLRIAGPGIEGAQPTSTTWQVARGQKQTQAGTAATGGKVVKLRERHLHFILAAGFALANPGFAYVVNLPPGQVRPYYASLQFTGLGGVSPLVEKALNMDPANVITPQATEDGVVVDGVIKSRVSLSWGNPSDSNFRGVNIYAKGYGGDNNWRFWHGTQLPATSWQFVLERTNETVYFKFISFSKLLAEADDAGSPGADDSISAVLDGNDSAPAAVTGLAAVQHGDAVHLEWAANAEADMRGYHIARRATAAAGQGDILDSEIIAAIPHVREPGGKIIWHDEAGSVLKIGAQYFYYVRAVDWGFNESAWRPDPPATLSLATETAPPVTGLSASEGPAISRDGHVVSRITVTFTAPSSSFWDYIEVWITGYQASANGVQVYSGRISPFRFDLEPTNETITIIAVTVTKHGLRNDATAPTTTVLLDGQASAPLTPSGFTGQALVARGQIVRLTWTENIEADIDHYEIARRSDATAPGDTDVVATVAAAGESASKKAQWDDAPGSASSQFRYYVRAVNTTNLKSAFAGPAAVTSLAPDGTTDIGVGSAPAIKVGVESTGNGEFKVWGGSVLVNSKMAEPGNIIIAYVNWDPSVQTSNNWVGAFEVEFTVVHYSDAAKTQEQTTQRFTFPLDPDLGSSWPTINGARFLIPLNNRYLGTVSAHLNNYFGSSSESSARSITSDAWTGSQAQDAKPPTANFDPAAQHYGATKLTSPATSAVYQLLSDRHDFDKPVNAVTGYRVGNAAASGNYLRGNGANFVSTAIQPGDLPLASATQAGAVSTGAQTFAGTKTFGVVIVTSISGSGWSINSSGFGVLASLDITTGSLSFAGGATRINNSGQWVLPFVNSAGGTHIDTGGGCNFSGYKINGTPGVNGTGST